MAGSRYRPGGGRDHGLPLARPGPRARRLRAHNTLFDPATRRVTAVVDWEWVHAGDPLEDLAWCEWIVRMHHPGHISALAEFFAAYGRRPAWPGRHEAMVSRCDEMLGICQRWEPDGDAVRRWQQRTQITRSWTDGQF